MNIRVTVDSAQVRHLLSILPVQVQNRVLRPAMQTAMKDVEANIKDSLSNRVLKVRSGTYRRSVKSGLRTIDGHVIADVWTDFKGARIHETQTSIVPKGRGFLTIPGPAAMTPAGVPRFNAVQALQMKAVGFAGQTIVKFTKGGRGPRVLLFSLTKIVHSRLRPVWAPAAVLAQGIMRARVEAALTQFVASLRTVTITTTRG